MKKPAKTPTRRTSDLEQRFTNLLTRILRVSKQEMQDEEHSPKEQPLTRKPANED